MVVKVGQTHSELREVWGGCPQGSILGVFLFNATIDDLEEGCVDLPDTRSRTRPAQDPAPACSTPVRRLPGHEADCSPIVRPSKNRVARRLDVTEEGRLEVPEEPNTVTEAKWKMRLGCVTEIYRRCLYFNACEL